MKARLLEVMSGVKAFGGFGIPRRCITARLAQSTKLHSLSGRAFSKLQMFSGLKRARQLEQWIPASRQRSRHHCSREDGVRAREEVLLLHPERMNTRPAVGCEQRAIYVIINVRKWVSASVDSMWFDKIFRPVHSQVLGRK